MPIELKQMLEDLPLASGTFFNARATALMTMSFTETLTLCWSAYLNK